MNHNIIHFQNRHLNYFKQESANAVVKSGCKTQNALQCYVPLFFNFKIISESSGSYRRHTTSYSTVTEPRIHLTWFSW